MNIETITQKANQTSRFSELPITAQISILYPLILEARAFGIPHKVICEAMNAAGSNVTLRYFREALKTVRAKYAKQGITVSAATTTAAVEKTTSLLQVNPVTVQPKKTTEVGQTTTKSRQEKADQYMNDPAANRILMGIKTPEEK